VIGPSAHETVISKVSLTSAARHGATNGANNNILSNPSRSIMHASPRRLIRKPPWKVHGISQIGANHINATGRVGTRSGIQAATLFGRGSLNQLLHFQPLIGVHFAQL